ncbi:MAG: hypothetical protein R3D45_09590 [Rhizobiaceae bacterium]
MNRIIALALVAVLAASGAATARDGGGAGDGGSGGGSGAGDGNGWDHTINTMGATNPGTSAFILFTRIRSVSGEADEHTPNPAPPAPTPPPSHDDDCMACP